MRTRDFEVAARQLAGVAEGLKREAAETEGALAKTMRVLAGVLEALAKGLGVHHGDLPDVGPVAEIPTRVASALRGVQLREDSYSIASRLYSTGLGLERGRDEHEVALGTTLRLLAEAAIGNVRPGVADLYDVEDLPEAVRSILVTS